MRANLETALAGGLSVAFFSGNEMYWKTRWESSSVVNGEPYRTLVCYKETLDNKENRSSGERLDRNMARCEIQSAGRRRPAGERTERSPVDHQWTGL
jgi:hypothetical protein